VWGPAALVALVGVVLLAPSEETCRPFLAFDGPPPTPASRDQLAPVAVIAIRLIDGQCAVRV
jgi:hypothetical protein